MKNSFEIDFTTPPAGSHTCHTARMGDEIIFSCPCGYVRSFNLRTNESKLHHTGANVVHTSGGLVVVDAPVKIEFSEN